MNRVAAVLGGLSKETLARAEAAIDVQIADGTLLRAAKVHADIAQRAGKSGDEVVLAIVRGMLRVSASETSRLLGDRAREVTKEALRKEGAARTLEEEATNLVREAPTEPEIPALRGGEP